MLLQGERDKTPLIVLKVWMFKYIHLCSFQPLNSAVNQKVDPFSSVRVLIVLEADVIHALSVPIVLEIANPRPVPHQIGVKRMHQIYENDSNNFYDRSHF